MAKTAIVTLADGFEEIEAMTQIDVLRRAGVEVTVAGLADPVTGARGVVVTPDRPLEGLDATPDLVVLPGGMPGAAHLGASAAVKGLVLRTLEAGGLAAAICAAPAKAFAPFGVLEGRRATCYPGLEGEFGPNTTHSEEPVVVDGPVITSRGVGTALDLALTLVELLFDKATAEDHAAKMVVSR